VKEWKNLWTWGPSWAEGGKVGCGSRNACRPQRELEVCGSPAGVGTLGDGPWIRNTCLSYWRTLLLRTSSSTEYLRCCDPKLINSLKIHVVRAVCLGKCYETLTDTHPHTIKHTFSTEQVQLTYCVLQNCALIFVFVSTGKREGDLNGRTLKMWPNNINELWIFPPSSCYI